MKFFVLVAVFIILAMLTACGSAEPIVSAGKVAVKLNPAYIPGGDQPRYTQVVTAGNRYDDQDRGIEIKDILVVPEGKLGWDGTRDLIPGPYPNLAMSDVTLFRDMTVVTAGWVAVHQTGDGTYRTLQPGRHFVPREEVVYVPTGSLRYRTLESSLLSDPVACSSFKCESSITRATVSDSHVELSVDVDVLFHFDTSDPQALWRLQDLEAAVQNYLGSTLRSSRAASAGFTSDFLATQEGREALQRAYLQPLNTATADTPIVVDEALVRSVTFGDEAWRKSRIEADQALAAEQAKAKLLAEQQANLEAENRLAADRAAFTRGEAILDADNQVLVIQKLLGAYAGQDWRVLWVLMNGAQVPPFLSEESLIQEPKNLTP